jgi:transcription antitermination factor NusG
MAAVDDVVRVLTGTFAGFAGRVTAVADDVVTVNVKVFGRATPVEVALDEVEPAGDLRDLAAAGDPTTILDQE